MKNIEKYLNNTVQTENGVVYKDEAAFKSKNGICYVSEYDLEDLRQSLADGEDLTDDEIIRRGIGETYGTIFAQVDDRWEELLPALEAEGDEGAEFTKEEVVDDVFCDLDWSYVSTLLDQLVNE